MIAKTFMCQKYIHSLWHFFTISGGTNTNRHQIDRVTYPAKLSTDRYVLKGPFTNYVTQMGWVGG